ncbi:MAG: hypothetical protein AABM66_04835 [Actinomycetota bacterium]
MTTGETRHRNDVERGRPAGRSSERRAEALVAAYIHELSSRHRTEREATRAEPDASEVRT